MEKDTCRGLTGVTPQFKRFAAWLAISLAAYRLLFSVFAPNAWHLPDEVLLAILIGIVGYMWMAQSQLLCRLSKSEAALREAQVGTLAALVEAVEAKDPYTRGHSEQVRRLSVALAEKAGLPKERIDIVSRAAVLHDVGKIETPDAILHKAGPLTQDEWKVLQKHPVRTATILSALTFLAEETRIAAFHHERVDGRGYCAGIKEPDIPLESSIIAVADTFDAMNSERPYRSKIPPDTIVAELRKGRGTQHPGELVDTFLELLTEQPELWIRL